MHAGRVTSAAGAGRRPHRIGPATILLLVFAIIGLSAAQPPAGMPGEPPPAGPPAKARPADQAAIDRAINLGVGFLQRNQNQQTGSWGTGTDVGGGGGWLVGYAALTGLALVECGVPTTDRGLQVAASVVRNNYTKIDSTYEVALAILFLDRMGNAKDRGVIQGLAARLIAGQTGSGGWAYKVPLPDPAQTRDVLAALRRLTPTRPIASNFSFRDRPGSLGLCIKMSDDIRPKPVSVMDAADVEKNRAAVVATLPAGMRPLPVFQDMARLALTEPEGKNSDPVNGTTDNSNTHFATLALWAARRHDVPTERSFALLARRFRSSQSGEGLWAYGYAKGGGGGTPAMTCIALLGLAIGHALAVDSDAVARADQDPAILKALGSLGKQLGGPVGTIDNRPTPKDVGGLYFLWALERIGVLYDLSTLGNKDWYKWGAEILLCHQKPDGSWEEGGYPGESPTLNTALALLFLKRANLTPDLSKRLIVDSSALTTRTSDPPPAPKPEPPPKTEPPPTITLPPLFGPGTTKEPPVEPPPPPTPPKSAASDPPAPAPTPAEPAPIWPWLAALGAVLLIGGGVLFFALRSGKADGDDEEDDEDEDSDEEKPKKKAKDKGGKDKGGKKPKK